MINISYSPLLWNIFFFLVFTVFIIDNYICNKKKIKKNFSKCYFFCCFYWLLASLFFVLILWFFVYKHEGYTSANSKIILFLTSYLLEILLSVDNVFIWFLIFQNLKIPIIFQKKVLSYGIWGALILRSIIIFSGKTFFYKYDWILYFFGIIFLITGFKSVFFRNKKSDINKKNTNFYYFYKIFRVNTDIYNEKFFFIKDKKLFFTPLFLSLITIEFSDIIFALDSIPAMFSLTDDFFIILTSNIFSILGLRSIYSFTSVIIKKNSNIKYGLSLILIFLGFKILLKNFFIISTRSTFFVLLIIILFTFIIDKILFYKKKF